MATYYVENFGCRATQADGAALERQFEERGLARSATSAEAEFVVMNTCTVTAAADQDARAAIRRLRRQNPEARIIVTGCYAQRAPQELADLPGVTCVVGNSHKHELAGIALSGSAGSQALGSHRSGWCRTDPGDDGAMPGALDASQPKFLPLATLSGKPAAGSPIFVSDIFAHTELQAATVFDSANERTRPNLKVQDGCDNRCSFCVIPYVRGQSRSLPLHQILGQVNALVAAGYREVVISGINLGRWGRDLDLSHFEDMLHAILAETALEKLRISSVEPMDWSDRLIALVAGSPRIARHAHVPMQSGSDSVLRRMHRKYRPWHYREKIEKIHAAMPTAAIGADVMVGFPGETDAEFEETRRMIEGLPFTYLHVFTYSPRPGTPAAAMADQVPVYAARERNRVLRELIAGKKQTFMRSMIGRTIEAITLQRASKHRHVDESERGVFGSVHTEALTDNYLRLILKERHQPNRWLRAHVEKVVGDELVGCVLQA